MLEVNLFVHLKLFPRQKHHTIDDGRIIAPFIDHTLGCPVCHKQSMIESVSLEYCGNCGYVQTDYWGLIPDKEKNILRNEE